jgi:nucleotide-binding universal stress UspA family protein
MPQRRHVPYPGVLNKPTEATMKNVLLLVHDDEGQEARLQVALDVVRAVEGHLTCLDVVVYPMFAGDNDFGAVGILLQDEHEIEAKNRQALEQRLAVEGLPWNWIDRTGSLAGCLTNAAAFIDLIVVNRKLEDTLAPDMRGIAGSVLLDASKPLLAVPEGARSLNLSGHAFVAWDGSEASIDALRAAIPLLKLAARVTILEIEDGSVSIPGEEAATYLSRYGVIAELALVRPQAKTAAAEILHQIALHKPDYLVAGGFGHSRLREALLGGVTRQMLTECPIPLFVAH